MSLLIRCLDDTEQTIQAKMMASDMICTIICCMLSTYLVYYSLFIHGRSIETCVDIVLDDDGQMTMLIPGSSDLYPHVSYDIHLGITFVDSWTTATAGLLSIQSMSSSTFIRPYPYSPAVWVMWRAMMFPGQVIGLVSDTLYHEVRLSLVKGTTLDGDVTRVSIIPTWHMADIVSVSGIYRPSNPNNLWIYVVTIVSICLSYGSLGRQVLIRIFR